MRNTFSLFVLLLFCNTVTLSLHAQRILTGRAVKIVDGDTFDLLAGGTVYRIRLQGIDCPERGQPYYRQATQALGRWCNYAPLRVVYRGKDRNGRILGDVYTANGNYINLKLIEEGMAWHFTRYSSSRQMALAERSARGRKVGLWSMPQPVAPWIWRSRGKKR